jgi:hypothetical protein
MVLVLVRILVVLQEHLNLVVHLWSDVVAEAIMARIPKLSELKAVVLRPTTYACWKAAPPATMMLFVTPGTLASAVAPSGRAARNAGAASADRPAAITAAGTSSAAFEDCTFVKIV